MTEHRELRSAVRGRVSLPSDADWDGARAAWNLAVDQVPVAVVQARSAEDVVATVRYAAGHGLRVAPQGTGHNAAPIGDLSGTVLLRTSAMRTVTVDPEARVVRAEAGVVWSEVTRAAQAHGLAALAGSAHDVGVVGYVLGGGISWLSRAHGLACNGVVAFEVVTGDGDLRRVDADWDPDLFWAMRGGGGAFGVVTAVELRLLPLEKVYAAALLWPIECAGEVLHTWRRWTDTVPDEVMSCGRLMQFPALPEVPEPLRGRAFAVVEVVVIGDEQAAGDLLAPLRVLGPRMDTGSMVPVSSLDQLHMDPPGPVPGIGDGALLGDLPAQAVDALVAVAGAGSGSPLLSVELRHLGGALARSPEGAGATATLDGTFLVFAVGITPDEVAAQRVRTHVDLVLDALALWNSGRAYLNYTESRADPRRFFDAATLARLRRIKATADPHDIVRANHPLS